LIKFNFIKETQSRNSVETLHRGTRCPPQRT